MNFKFPQNATPPPVKYHGLINQGATCYLNSVLQVLFMSRDFRAAVQSHTCENPDSDCIDCHLTTLFDDLKGQTAYTNKITNKLGIYRVYEQHDAAEYFEKIVSLTSPEASQIFHGMLTHKTMCSACCTETDTDGAFWHIPLALMDSYSKYYSVVDGIKEHFRVSDFSGENQLYCDQCDAKSDATLRCVMKHHPEVLMLLLKRFEFDYRYMTYVKISCTVDVPCTLQIPVDQIYELYAVVDHFGDLRSGHYTATVKSQDDERWYNFNDDRVTLLDNQLFQEDNFVKSCSAYLLFYRKKDVHAADNCVQDTRELSTPEDVPPATSSMYDQCQDAVKMRERAEVGNDTAVAVSIGGIEETGIKDRVESRGVGLPSDPRYNVEHQDTIPYKDQECNEERNDMSYHFQDAHADKQKDEGKMITDDSEDRGGNADADEQTETRETFVRETELEDTVKDQENDSGRQRTPDISHDFKPEVSDNHVIHDHLTKRDEMRTGMDVKTDKDGETGDDEQSEKKGNALYSQSRGRVGDSKQNMPNDDQRCEQGGSSRYKRRQQQREKKRDVKKQKRGDDKYAQSSLSKGVSSLKLNESKMCQVSHAQEATGKKHAMKKRGENKRVQSSFSFFKKHRKDKNKKKKTTSCLPCTLKRKKNKDPIPDSD